MHRIFLLFTLLALLAGLGAAQYHRPVFITGGYGYTTSTYYMPGLHLVDGANKTVTSLFPAGIKSMYIYDAMMDADNRRIVFTASTSTSTTYNLKGGIFRLDPSNGKIETIVAADYPNYGPMYYQYRSTITQDGEYAFGSYSRIRQTVPITTTRYDYYILKIDAAQAVTTVFSSVMLGLGHYDRAYFQSVIGTDIDTGNLLLNTHYSGSTIQSQLGRYPWIRVDPTGNGKWSTFSGGRTTYCKTINYTSPNQDYATGNIEEIYAGRLYVQPKGNKSFTTIWNFGYPGHWYFRYNGMRDLQSAPGKRWCVPGTFQKYSGSYYWYSPAYAALDGVPPYAATMVDCDPAGKYRTRYNPTYYYPYTWTFYRGRNIQSIKVGSNRWQIRFSCPWYAQKPYVAVLGASGIRPGVPLPSGRTIWINVDTLVTQSLRNALIPIFNPGPGLLDKDGEAIAYLDTSQLPKLNGTPVWIALAVLDPKAPDGIAFLPDTYVMKLP